MKISHIECFKIQNLNLKKKKGKVKITLKFYQLETVTVNSLVNRFPDSSLCVCDIL